MTQIVKADRPGPDHLWQLSTSAVRRWRTPADRLPESRLYRPASLAKVEDELAASPPFDFVAPTDLVDTVVVREGDTLGAYAAKYYGDARLYPAIYEGNLDVLDDADDLFEGQRIRIPKRPSA